MHDLGLYVVKSCRSQRHRYQTPRNLLIYKSPFGNYERVTDSLEGRAQALRLESYRAFSIEQA